MSKPNENEILARLKELSQIEPSSEATSRAVQKVRALLMKEQDEYVSSGMNTRRALFAVAIAKFAAAAIIFVGFGFLAGRLSAPRPLDMKELQVAMEASLKPSLESSITQDVLEQVQEELTSVLTANNAVLKDEFQRQVNQDLTEFAAQTIATFRTLSEQNFNELVDLIEEARQRDRRQVEAALSQIRQQTTKFGTGLVALATQADEILRTQQN